LEELWTMSNKELDRATVMARLAEGSLSQGSFRKTDKSVR